MGNLTPPQARALRRRRLHERQAVVYGSLVAVLAIAALGGAAVYTDALELNFLARDFTTPEPEPTVSRPAVACLPEGTLPVPYAQVQVNVLNGSNRPGLASETANAVTTRGFVVAETGNNSDAIAWPVRLGFGPAGLAAAVTLAAHLDDPVMALDTRTGADVDLVLGEAFTGLLDPAFVLLDPTLALVGPTPCVPLEEALLEAPEPRERTPAEGPAGEEGDPQDGGEDLPDGGEDMTDAPVEPTEPATEG